MTTPGADPLTPLHPYVTLPPARLERGRYEAILRLCSGKRVLHVGCVDAGLLEERFAKGDLLHQRLGAVTTSLWGLDVDREGLAFLERMGVENLVHGDVGDPAWVTPFLDTEVDVVLASEVVEHLPNPGVFLTGVRRLLAGGAELVVTVPNAFGLRTLLPLLRGVEHVHPDHKYWFSYHTIVTLLRTCGLEPVEVAVYSFTPTRLLPSAAAVRSLLGRSRSTSPGARPERKADRTSEAFPFDAPPSDAPSAAAYVRSLPTRLLARMLYRRTPFWGDGLIVRAVAATD